MEGDLILAYRCWWRELGDESAHWRLPVARRRFLCGPLDGGPSDCQLLGVAFRLEGGELQSDVRDLLEWGVVAAQGCSEGRGGVFRVCGFVAPVPLGGAFSR